MQTTTDNVEVASSVRVRTSRKALCVSRPLVGSSRKIRRGSRTMPTAWHKSERGRHLQSQPAGMGTAEGAVFDRRSITRHGEPLTLAARDALDQASGGADHAGAQVHAQRQRQLTSGCGEGCTGGWGQAKRAGSATQ